MNRPHREVNLIIYQIWHRNFAFCGEVVKFDNQRLGLLASTDRSTTLLNQLEKKGFQQNNKEIAFLLCSLLQLNCHYERLSFLLGGDGVDLATVATSWQQLPWNKFPM